MPFDGSTAARWFEIEFRRDRTELNHLTMLGPDQSWGSNRIAAFIYIGEFLGRNNTTQLRHIILVRDDVQIFTFEHAIGNCLHIITR